MQLAGLVEHPRLAVDERPQRPQTHEAEERHGVRPERVRALDARDDREARHDAEDLQRDAALAQPRDVDVSFRAPLQEIASPEERIGVQIDDGSLAMQRRGALGYRGCRRVADAIDEAT